MILVGLTGGIGSGKSTVAKYLVEVGAAHIDADKIGHEVYRNGTPGWRAIINEFSAGVLDSDGTIDRKKLGAAVFGDAARLARLNSIVHPLIRQRVEGLARELGQKGVEVVVIEGAVLIEAGWKVFLDEIWTVAASERDAVQRVKATRNASEEDILARIRAQMTNEERKRHSLVVIENNGNLDELREKVHREWERLMERHKPQH